MPKLKTLSGKDIVSILEKFGFVVVGQKGSHVKLKRVLNGEIKQTITIPNHDELDKGTTKAIHNQIARYVPETELKSLFYVE